MHDAIYSVSSSAANVGRESSQLLACHTLALTAFRPAGSAPYQSGLKVSPSPPGFWHRNLPTPQFGGVRLLVPEWCCSEPE